MVSHLHKEFFFLLQRLSQLLSFLSGFRGGNVLKTDFYLYEETLNPRHTHILDCYHRLPNQTLTHEKETQEVTYNEKEEIEGTKGC